MEIIIGVMFGIFICYTLTTLIDVYKRFTRGE